MSTDTPITKREMEGLLHGVHQRLDNYEKRFDRLETSLNQRCDHLDDLVETVASEVNSISTILEPLVPVQHDHEQRISRLERGYTRLILKS